MYHRTSCWRQVRTQEVFTLPKRTPHILLCLSMHTLCRRLYNAYQFLQCQVLL